LGHADANEKPDRTWHSPTSRSERYSNILNRHNSSDKSCSEQFYLSEQLWRFCLHRRNCSLQRQSL